MSQTFTTAELDVIKAAAEAATPGPWHWINSINDKPRQPGEYQSSLRTVEQFPSFISEAYPDHTLPKFILEAEDIEDANADFIAAANPDTVLRLVKQARPMEWKNEYPKTPGDWLLAGGQFLKNVCVFQMWDEEKVRAFSGENPQQDIFYYGPLPKPPEAK